MTFQVISENYLDSLIVQQLLCFFNISLLRNLFHLIFHFLQIFSLILERFKGIIAQNIALKLVDLSLE